MTHKQDEINRLVDYLVEKLLEKGFVIQRYDSYSTNSIYLKLDYGVCNSIRISDHEGKKYLKYRYNIGPHIKKYRYREDKYPRYYFQAKEAERLLEQINKEKCLKIKRYGTETYQMYMEKNKIENNNKSGFWKKARLIGGRK